jgi:GTP-binding protein
MRHMPTEQDIQMIEFLVAKNIPFIVALTKCDKLNKTERINNLVSICEIITKYGNISVIPFSATKGDGVEDVRRHIQNAVENKGDL